VSKEDEIIACDHCQLEFKKSVMIEKKINGEDKYFCCNGCAGVYSLLHDKEMESFYDKVGSAKLAPPKEKQLESANFDSESFMNQYVKKTSDGNYAINLVIENIHCSACVWLNEQILYETDGVIEAKINFSTNRAKIVFDLEIIKLSQIIDIIRSIGYDAKPYEISQKQEKLTKERKDYYIRMAVAIFGTMNIMWIAIAQYVGYFTGIEQSMKTVLNYAEWILATPVLFFSGWIFFRGAYFGLKNRFVNMDLLVATGAFLTYLYSIYITLFELGEAYFDSVSMIITFILIGKFLELISKKNISESLDLVKKYQPLEVEIRDQKTGEIKKILTENIKIDDILILKAGDRVGVDGEIIQGSGNFDESSLTGEFEPVLKTEKNNFHILSGTLLLEGYVEYRATKTFKNSRISILGELLEEALNNKPKIETLANRISGVFSSVILILSILTFGAWFFATSSDFNTAFIVSVSVIIIACPCALGLATPIATLVGLNIGTRRGILFKEASFLETMSQINVLAIDKTGTLTEGKPKVINFQNFDNLNINLIKKLVKSSKHPISKSVFEYLNTTKTQESEQQQELINIKTITGKGIKAEIKNTENIIIGGNINFIKEELKTNINNFDDEVLKNISNSVFIVVIKNKNNSINKHLMAIFELQDTIRPEAKETLNKIKKQNIKIVMLTGDNQKSAEAIAKELDISEIHSEMSPEDKAIFVKKIQNNNQKIVMVGDGINDTLALSTADIGIAMGSGTDIALEVSDVVISNESLNTLYESFYISKLTFGLIKQNLKISFVYNALTVPLAMAGYIIPLIAAISMSFSSILVVLNSLKIDLYARYKLK
jgi:Cu+-exporting ATPase